VDETPAPGARSCGHGLGICRYMISAVCRRPGKGRAIRVDRFDGIRKKRGNMKPRWRNGRQPSAGPRCRVEGHDCQSAIIDNGRVRSSRWVQVRAYGGGRPWGGARCAGAGLSVLVVIAYCRPNAPAAPKRNRRRIPGMPGRHWRKDEPEEQVAHDGKRARAGEMTRACFGG